MTRRYRIATPTAPVEIVAARVVVEAGGALVAYATPAGAERECIVAAFSPTGWLRCEVAHD